LCVRHLPEVELWSFFTVKTHDSDGSHEVDDRRG
jgi:hypothetical protein